MTVSIYPMITLIYINIYILTHVLNFIDTKSKKLVYYSLEV